MKEEEKKQAIKNEDLFIDIGAKSREDALNGFLCQTL